MRIHHPDSLHCRNSTSPSEAHARFQSITRAYDILRGRHHPHVQDPIREELELRRRDHLVRQRYRRTFVDDDFGFAHSGPGHRGWTASADDRWKDKVIVVVGLLVRNLRLGQYSCSDAAQSLGAGLGPVLLWPVHDMSYKSHLNAAANLAQARREAREFGDERRETIRRRVREHKGNFTKPNDDDCNKPSIHQP